MKKKNLSVLIVDDDKNIRNTLLVTLRGLGHIAESSESVKVAMEKLKNAHFDVCLTDFRMENETGLDLIKKASKLYPQLFIVVMTAYASIENAVSVVKEGAYDYLAKPFGNVQLEHLLSRIQKLISLQEENEELKKYRYRRDFFSGMTSPSMQGLEEFIKKIAPSEATILLTGESGTGKSELARLIHELSPRKGRPFISVFCTTIVESLLESELFGHVAGSFTGATANKAGKFEMASGGTLFLDEIGDLSPTAQAKLLRFLQDRVIERVGSNEEISVDARIIAATNKKLDEAVKEGKFREDLFFRMNTLECPLVSLRHRKEDIPVLIKKFLEEARIVAKRNEVVEISSPVMEKLLQYNWPGNIRELKNVIERLTLLVSNRPAMIEDLPDAIRDRPTYHDVQSGVELRTLEQVEREHIAKVLKSEKNFEKAAHILGITSVTLWRKRKEYGID